MTPTEVLVQLDAIEAMERGMTGTRRSVAMAIREQREKRELSLRDVAPHVGVTHATLSNIENGKTWTTGTVRKVARYYQKLNAA